MTTKVYIGQELELFGQAVHWKKYFSSLMAADISGRVLEVGAGIGATTEMLCGTTQKEWLCLEPDPSLAHLIEEKIERKILLCKVQSGTLHDLAPEHMFETILYIDVLEHIEDDKAEMELAAEHLSSGGALIVLAPAHPALYSPFDRAVGHYRRYTKSSLRSVMPRTLEEKKLLYLDSLGFFASCANKFFLRQSLPAAQQILFWDRFLVPPSILLDSMFRYTIGRSLLGIWVRS